MSFDTDSPDRLWLRDGTRLRVRPIRPDDRGRLAALFDRLSPESRHRRFLAPKPRLTGRELTYLTEVDHVTHEALVAVDDDGAIVGVSRYAAWHGRDDVAEIAVAVADDLHRRGIGGALADRIVREACANGIARLTAATLWGNRPAFAVLKRLGFRITEHGPVVELALDLRAAAAAPPHDATAAAA
jgi:RimJ/RimL family protein N-acetyltransferase